MGSLSPMHWLIVVGVLALLFGARRLPDVARSVGQSARLFKGEMKGLATDDGSPLPSSPVAATPVPEQAVQRAPNPTRTA